VTKFTISLNIPHSRYDNDDEEGDEQVLDWPRRWLRFLCR